MARSSAAVAEGVHFALEVIGRENVTLRDKQMQIFRQACAVRNEDSRNEIATHIALTR